MGVKYFGRDCPCSVFLQQCELIREAVAEPAGDLDPRGGNSFREIDVGDVGRQIRCRRVFGDPVEQHLDRSGQQAAANVSVNRGVFTKCGFHDRRIAPAPAFGISLDDGCNGFDILGVVRGL